MGFEGRYSQQGGGSPGREARKSQASVGSNREAGHRGEEGRGPGCTSQLPCSEGLFSPEMAPGLQQGQRVASSRSEPLPSQGLWGLSLLLSLERIPHMPPRLAGPEPQEPQPPWPGAWQTEVSFGRQWWGREVPACCPDSGWGSWGTSGGQWCLHLSGETDSLQALDLRACQVVGTLRPFSAQPPGA